MGTLPETARVLVINIARIGDTLLSTPLLRALKTALPRGELTCIAHPRRIEVLRGLPFIDHLLPMTKRSAFWRARLGGKRYDLVLAMGRDPIMLRYALRAGHRVVAFSQADSAINGALTVRVNPPTDLIPAVTERLLLAEAIGIPPASLRLAYVVTPTEAEWAATWLREHGLEGRRLVCVQAASFPTKAYRDWPEAHFRDLISRLLAHCADTAIVLLGDSSDRPRAERLAAGFSPRIAVAAGTASLRQSAALLAKASLYVGIDTGITHLAGALGIPMVALYHCMHPGRCLAPLEHPAYLAVLEHPASAGDCSERSSMAEVSVDAVWRRVEEALG